jgi:heme-degrading monooxygenase HmoA
VSTFELQSDKRAELVAALNKSPVWEEALPLLRQIRGFKGVYTMVEAGSDKALMVVLYETEADAQAGGDSPQAKEVWAKFMSYVKMGSITRKVHAVIAHG